MRFLVPLFLVIFFFPLPAGAVEDTDCSQQLGEAPLPQYFIPILKLENFALAVSLRAELIGDKMAERQANREVAKIQDLLADLAYADDFDPRDEAIEIQSRVAEIDRSVKRQEREINNWLGFSELTDYLGRAGELPEETPLKLNSPSFPDTDVYFHSQVLHEFDRSPEYGTRVLTLIMKGFVRPVAAQGVKPMADTEVREWSVLEVKTMGYPFGDRRILIAAKPGELRVFRLLHHNRTQYGTRNILLEFLNHNGL